MTALSLLSMNQLQAEVGHDRLDSIEKVLSIVDKDYVEGQVYGSKSVLERILIAFGGAEKLADAQFRKRLFSHLSPARLQEIANAAGVTPEGAHDELASRLAAIPWTSSGRAEVILGCLGLPESLAPKPKKIQARFVEVPSSPAPYFPLKDYQADVFYRSIQQLETPLARFMVQMPTGSGKTRTAMEIVATVLNHRGGTVVWVAHAEELCNQACQAFIEVWQHIGRSPAGLLRVFGNGSGGNGDAAAPRLVVASFQRLHSEMDGGSIPTWCDPERIHLVVVDEAHKVIAPTYRSATKALFGSETRCIGLTATPGRSVDNFEANKELSAFFFEKMVTFDSGHVDPVRYLRSKGVLAEAHYVPLRTNVDFELTSREAESLEKFFDYPKELLARVGAHALRNAEIIKRIQEELGNGAQVIFFGCSVEHSRFICSALTYLGHSAAHIDGGTPREVREQCVKSFKVSELRVLCNFEVLSTGFDAPKTDVVFISRPTRSLVLYSQMIGRGLRGPAVGGKAQCRIVDVIDNIAGFSDPSGLYSFFSGYWED